MFFSKTLVVLSLALSALALPHVARGSSHHGLAHRAAIPEPVPEPMLVPVKASRRKRASSGRCRTNSTSTAIPTASSHVSTPTPLPTSTTTPTPSSSSVPLIPPKNVESAPPSSSSTHSDPTPTPTPTTTKTTSRSTTTKPTTTKKPESTTKPTSTSAPPPPPPSSGSHSGDGTFYGTGLGSCGIVNKDTDFIVAVSQLLYDGFDGYTGGNPNNNPICGKKIRANYKGNSVVVTAVDRCVGCAKWDLDFSPSAFDQLADQSIGRLHGVTWDFI